MRRLLRIAKALLRIAASENKKNFLAQKYVVPPDIISQLDRIDPSRGKYLEWMVRRVEENNILWPEDSTRVQQALQDFQVLTQKKNIREQYGVNPDINTYTLHDLEDFGDRLHGRENRPESLAEIPPGAAKVYDDGVFALLKVKTPEAACSLASGTKWCTSDPEVAEEYLQGKGLWVVFKNGVKYAQANHGSLMDLRDRDLRDEDLMEVLANEKILGRPFLIQYIERERKRRWPEIEPYLKTLWAAWSRYVKSFPEAFDAGGGIGSV